MTVRLKYMLVFLLVLLLLAVLQIDLFAAVSEGLIIRDITNQLPKHPSREYAKRSLNSIQQIVIHHTAGPVNQTAQDIARYHTGANHICDEGCPGISYHYLVDRNANIFQVNALDTISYHVKDQNTKSVGICFIGNYDDIPPTNDQLDKGAQLISTIQKKLGRSLSIIAHRDATLTNCPGHHINLEDIKNRLQA